MFGLAALMIIFFLLKFSNPADGQGNCNSLPSYDYGYFDKCADGNSCPKDTVATLYCPRGFRVSGEGKVKCEQLETKGGIIGAVTNDKPIPVWNPVIAPTCVVDQTHCQPLKKFENGVVDKCATGACPQQTDVKFTCNPGYITCGAVTISCQKLSELSSGWSANQPTCVPEGQPCDSWGTVNGLMDFTKIFTNLFKGLLPLKF